MESTYTLTFTYRPGELGPQPEDISVHTDLTLESARNLASFNMDNTDLVSILIERVGE